VTDPSTRIDVTQTNHTLFSTPCFEFVAVKCGTCMVTELHN